MVPGGTEPDTVLTRTGRLPPGTFVRQMMYLDTVTYLPNDILVKLDRASMATARNAGAASRPCAVQVRVAASVATAIGTGRGGSGKVSCGACLIATCPGISHAAEARVADPGRCVAAGAAQGLGRELLSEDSVRRFGS